MSTEDTRFDKIGEMGYWIMIVFQLLLIGIATIGTSLVRKVTGTEIVLIPKEILDYSLDVFKIVVLPVSVKIAGEMGVRMLLAYRGKDSIIATNQEEVKDL